MVWTPNRVVLKSPYGQHDEFLSSANLYPAMITQLQSDGSIVPHATVGGGGPLRVVLENAWYGQDVTQVILSGNNVAVWVPNKGDLLLFLLAAGQSVVAGAGLMSDGLGALKAATTGGGELYHIVAPSTVITNVGTETTFSNGSYSIPANFLVAGDVIRIHTKATLVAQNSTNTHRVRLYVNATTLADSTALALTAADVAIFDVEMTIRTIGATGTFVADGVVRTDIAGTFTTTPFTIVSTTLDTTAAAVLAIKSLASATSAGNQIRLDEMEVSLDRAGQVGPIVYAAETINNSAGLVNAFIRATVA